MGVLATSVHGMVDASSLALTRFVVLRLLARLSAKCLESTECELSTSHLPASQAPAVPL